MMAQISLLRPLVIGLFVSALNGCETPTAGETTIPEGFVKLSSLTEDIIQDIRYAGGDNFVGRPVDGYLTGECILATAAAEALVRVQMKLESNGLGLVVFDCYRPQRAVDDFVSWSLNDDQSTKNAFYPNLQKDALFSDGYIARQSGHSRGATVDLAVVRLTRSDPGGNGQNVPCTEVMGSNASKDYLDFGTAFDCFDTLSNTSDPRVSGQVAENRTMLVDVMASEGFANYPLEWWHFTFRPEPFPDKYFDFPIE
ncbi:MAG: M15 family metallopeptidase [Pseudomonadota bacterium]